MGGASDGVGGRVRMWQGVEQRRSRLQHNKMSMKIMIRMKKILRKILVIKKDVYNAKATLLSYMYHL